jgi:hypothetical protein
MATAMPKFEEPPARAVVFHSWKEIATYLNRGVRTVQRWHLDLQLPIHRENARDRSQVFAYKAELDQWLHKCAQTDDCLNDGPTHNPRLVRALAGSTKLMSLASTQREQVARIAQRVAQMVKREKSRKRVSLTQ